MMWVHSTQSAHGSIWTWPQWKLRKEQALKTVQLFFTQPNKERIFLRRRGKKQVTKNPQLWMRRDSQVPFRPLREGLSCEDWKTALFLVTFMVFGDCHLCRLESNKVITYYLPQYFLYNFADCCWQLSPTPTEVIENFYNSLKSISD